MSPDPEHMCWFEFNFLYVLTTGEEPKKSSLGDHTVLGYQQCARFYRISSEARLAYLKNIATYLIFLAESTGIASKELITKAQEKLLEIKSESEFLSQI